MDGDKNDSQNAPEQSATTTGPAQTAQPETSQESPAQATTESEFDQTLPEPSLANGQTVTWVASEFIAHTKTVGWYAALFAVTVVFAAVVWLLTKDMVATVVIVFAGLLFGTYAARKPKQINYALDGRTLTVGQRSHPLNEFRSYTIMPEGAFSSIMLMPLQRFGLITTIYFDPQDEAAIVDILSRRLPHEERKPDAIDRVLRRIRF